MPRSFRRIQPRYRPGPKPLRDWVDWRMNGAGMQLLPALLGGAFAGYDSGGVELRPERVGRGQSEQRFPRRTRERSAPG